MQPKPKCKKEEIVAAAFNNTLEIMVQYSRHHSKRWMKWGGNYSGL